MNHSPSLCVLLSTLLISTTAAAQDAPKKKAAAALAEILKGSADDFIKRFDKNKDGYLSRDELPPRLAERFDRFDQNQDDKLDRKEVEQMLQLVRKALGQAANAPAKKGGEADRVVNDILQRMDKNNDGMVSKDEAMGPLKEAFDRLDRNKDGFLDKDELRTFAERRLALGMAMAKGGDGRPLQAQRNRPDFDALDKDADGRLTREELKGTPYEDVFDQIDTNKDGKIDKKEFEAYLKKQEEKAKPDGGSSSKSP
jgi:Ca2+-binding EF-hand superfamily protein